MALNAEAIIFLPALLCDSRLYSAQVRHYSGRIPMMVADLSLDTTITTMVDRILASAPPRFALVGNSMGGYVALALACQAPERVSHLALIGTNALADAPAAKAKRQQAIRLAEGGKFESFIDGYVEGALYPQHQIVLAPLMRQMARDLGPDALVRQQKAIMARGDSMAALAALKMPSLVMAGTEDGFSSHQHQQVMASALPDCRYFSVPRCGHLVPLEAAGATVGALDHLLAC